MLKVEGERFWIYATVHPEINHILHVGLYPTRNTEVTKRFLRELDEKHDICVAEFSVDGARGAMRTVRARRHFWHETFGEWKPDVRVLQEIKRRTEQLYNHFGNADSETVENRLLALARAENYLN